MREIKFRAWDKSDQIMISCESLTQQVWNVFNSIVNQSGDWVFMQYTSLKDKNGKEVFEGDIRACYDKEGVLVYNQEVKIPGIYQEIWDETNSEVIGNIYQNLELLK